MTTNDENRIRCSQCGCLFDRRRGICPFCGTPLVETRRVTRTVQTENIPPSSFERKVIKALRRADTQRTLMIVLLAGNLAMDLLLLIVMLLK